MTLSLTRADPDFGVGMPRVSQPECRLSPGRQCGSSGQVVPHSSDVCGSPGSQAGRAELPPAGWNVPSPDGDVVDGGVGPSDWALSAPADRTIKSPVTMVN